MAGVGGYQRPSNPAPVSGPGKYSQRTDGGPGETMKQAARYVSGLPYGEGQAFMDVQQSAPLAAANGMPSAPPVREVVPFDAPTQRPDEPVTAGAPFGDGPGPEVFGGNGPVDTAQDAPAMFIRAMYAAAPSLELRRLVERLNAEGR